MFPQSRQPSYVDPANEVWPNLFVGGKQAAMNPIFISRVHLIVNCAADEVPCYSKNVDGASPPHYYVMSVKDDCTEGSNLALYDNLDTATSLIHKCLSQQQTCYVHCHVGAQRSCAVVAAYLMRYHKMPLEYAVSYLKMKRSIAFCGGIHFLYALRKYEQAIILRRKLRKRPSQEQQHQKLLTSSDVQKQAIAMEEKTPPPVELEMIMV
jgi:protein-tyrosine phosphatase